MASLPDTRAAVHLDEDVVEAVAGTLRALADPTRIRLIELLDAGGPASVGGLASSLPLTRQAVSRQLCVLHGAGIVGRRREGMRVVYELCDWTGLWLLGQVADSVSSAP